MKHFWIIAVLVAGLLNGCGAARKTTDKKNAFMYYTRSLEAYQKGAFKEALAYSRACIRNNPGFAGYYEWQGDVLARMDSLEQALAAYQDALERRSHNFKALEKSGDIHFARHRFDQAVEMYEKAFAQNDSALYLLLKQAESWLQKDAPKVGVHILRDYILKLKKRHRKPGYDYYITHARLMFETGQFFKIAVDMRAAERKGMPDRNAALIYIQSLFNTQQLEEGYTMATSVYKPLLKAADVHYFRALYYFKQNNPADGNTQLKLAVKKGCAIPDAYGMLNPSVRKSTPPAGVADRFVNVGFDFNKFLDKSLPALQSDRKMN
ncbi:MAG: hypothetical protein D6677_09275 [Calditrichaeota bacterium]|nr:MAG: hypothetical protein D6677_09275 [Calditrichota bacterium]